MMETFLFLSLLSACTGCLISASLPPVAKESQVAGNKLLTWGETAGVDYEIVGLLQLCIESPISSSLQTPTRTGRLCCQATCPPSQPFTLHPASSLPPTTGPKRREHAVSETRPGQVVLGSGCRCCTQNQMPAAAAGMLARPLRYPLTSDTALHAYS